MKIHHRGIIEDRYDAPYGIGALIWAANCHNGCPGCIHADRKDLPIYEEDSTDIIEKIKLNPFTQGIILAGYEWTEQPEEMYHMIELARANDLEVILYTHCTIEEISTAYNRLLSYKNLYIKIGAYEEDKKVYDYSSYGVPLATSNQKIVMVGKDI